MAYYNKLKLLTAYFLGSDMTVDDRWYNMHLVITGDIPTTLGYFYPRLIPIHTLADESSLDNVSIPDQLRCSIEKFSEDGAYILGKSYIFCVSILHLFLINIFLCVENGVYMFLWLGSNLSQTFLSDVFGVQNIAHVDVERSAVPVIDNPFNRAVRQVLSKIQEQRSHTMRVCQILYLS